MEPHKPAVLGTSHRTPPYLGALGLLWNVLSAAFVPTLFFFLILFPCLPDSAASSLFFFYLFFLTVFIRFLESSSTLFFFTCLSSSKKWDTKESRGHVCNAMHWLCAHILSPQQMLNDSAMGKTRHLPHATWLTLTPALYSSRNEGGGGFCLWPDGSVFSLILPSPHSLFSVSWIRWAGGCDWKYGVRNSSVRMAACFASISDDMYLV